MKSTLVKKISLIIFIGATVFLFGCNSTAEKNNTTPKVDSEVLNLKDFETKALDELNNISDKLSGANDANSINTILSEYYELGKGNTANIFFAKESGEFYLNPKQILPQEYDARKRDWYIQTIKNTNYISKQYQDVVSGRTIVTVARIVSKDNITIGVIGIDKFIN